MMKDWNLLDFTLGYKKTDYKVERPQTLEKMKEFCKNFIEKRNLNLLDFMKINNEVYFENLHLHLFVGLVDFSNNYDKIMYDKYVKNI